MNHNRQDSEKMKEIALGSMVISTNPLYVAMGIGHVQQVRGLQAKVEFRPTIFSDRPYLTESRILKMDELKVVKGPLERLRYNELEDPWRFELKQRAAHLLVCNRDGQLSDARTDLLPHQISIAHTVVSSPRKRFLIADEVGLGKTVEAGMILYAFLQRGLANRVLIVTPAGLTLQWQEEMKEKFGFNFAVYKEDVQGVLAFETNDRLVASIDTLKLDKPRKKGQVPGHKTLAAGARRWDTIIFDEAHKLSAKTWSAQKTEKTLNFRLAEELEKHCDSLILLTGTPHQGDESKFQNLIGLLHEHVVFDEWAKKSETAVRYTDLVLRNQKSKVTDADGNPIFKGMEVHPARVKLLSSGEKAFHRELEAYLREGYGYAGQDPTDTTRKAIGFVMTTFQKLAASSTAAIKGALRRRASNLRQEVQQRAQIEKAEYDARFAGEKETEEADQIMDPFVETELALIEHLLSMSVPEDAKTEELFKVIDSISRDNPHQRILIFTEYRESQNFVCQQLEKRYGEGCTTIIRGGMTLWEKKKSQESFRDNPEVRFLVSTEAGSEGINLQFCHIMINYDLPWNPFRLAQRYGRLYRYGQDKVVQVFSFQNSGTIEDKVRQYLEQKTKIAAYRLAKMTGENAVDIEQGLLGLYEELLDYEKIYREGLEKGDSEPSKSIIDEGVKKAEAAYKIAYNSLFSKDIAPFNPDRFNKEIKSPLTLWHVEKFVSEFVRRHGRAFTKSEHGTYEFLLPTIIGPGQGIEKRYSRVTFDREKAIRYSELEFLALGHPFTNAAIKYCGSAEIRGFAAVRQIESTRFHGLQGLHFNFIVKRIKRTKEEEEIFFDLLPVFIDFDGNIHEEAAKVALQAWGSKPIPRGELAVRNGKFAELYTLAHSKIMEKYSDEGLWEEDVFCLNAALTRFL